MSPDTAAPDMDQDAFTEEDRASLALYENMVETIARLVGPSCEVVLHSLEDLSHSVVKIEHGEITGRTVGSPLTDLALKALNEGRQGATDIIGPYLSKTGNKTLRSITVLLRNLQGKLIGFLCINIDLSAPFLDFTQALIRDIPAEILSPGEVSPALPAEHYASSMKDMVLQALKELSPQDGKRHKRELVQELERKGLFKIKGAVEAAAEILKVSKHTVYYYIRTMKKQP